MKLLWLVSEKQVLRSIMLVVKCVLIRFYRKSLRSNVNTVFGAGSGRNDKNLISNEKNVQGTMKHHSS